MYVLLFILYASRVITSGNQCKNEYICKNITLATRSPEQRPWQRQTKNMADVLRPNSLILDEMSEINTDTNTKPQQNHYENISLDDYDASKQTPVFYGWFPRKISEILCTDNEHISSASQMQLNCARMEKDNEEKRSVISEFNAAVAHPAIFGYILLDKKPVVEVKVEDEIPIPEALKCKPREYCEYYIFPILLPALEKMLVEAKANKVFEVNIYYPKCTSQW